MIPERQTGIKKKTTWAPEVVKGVTRIPLLFLSMNSLKFSVKVIMLTNVWGMRKRLGQTKKGLGLCRY